jgi:hypothetical protein
MSCVGATFHPLGGIKTAGECFLPGNPPLLGGFVYAKNGRPVTAAKVLLWPYPMRAIALAITTTSKDGSYYLPPMPDGTYEVTIIVGYKTLFRAPVMLPLLSPDELNFTLADQ